MMMSFKDASNVPSWMAGFGKNLGAGQIKKLINAIVTLAAATITYTIIMVILAKFFANTGVSTAEMMDLINSGQIFASDLNYENLAAITLIQVIVLVYVLNFIYSQIPQVTNMILGAFNVSSENKLNEELANNVMGLTDLAVNKLKSGAKIVFSGGKGGGD